MDIIGVYFSTYKYVYFNYFHEIFMKIIRVAMQYTILFFYISYFEEESQIKNQKKDHRGRIVLKLDLQLPMKSVPITSKVVSSNPDDCEVYSTLHYVMKFVSDLQQDGGFNKIDRHVYNWNIVESGVKNHNPSALRTKIIYKENNRIGLFKSKNKLDKA
jgi:hypothetical protein